MVDDPKRFRFLRLEGWQEGGKRYRTVSRVVRVFPPEELHGLTTQRRRSARSGCAKVAGGRGRNSDKDFAQFVEIAYGSAMELASDGYWAMDEGYLPEAELDLRFMQIEVVASKASGLYRKLTGHGSSGPPPSTFRAPRPSS